jgi:RNA polymerase sigma-70 factor (ECF subfamily)
MQFSVEASRKLIAALSPIPTGLENLYAAEPTDERTPESIYEVRWASAVMSRAFEQLRAEHQGERQRLFEALQPFVWGDKSGGSHAQTAASLGLSGGAVRVAIHRLRRRYRELLRQEIAHTVANVTQVDDQLRYLVQIVSRSPL